MTFCALSVKRRIKMLIILCSTWFCLWGYKD
ncbi:MAG TPA: hypothetical protein DCP71_16245 [Verrucomicrobiales bacterium]|nr:hypothetical protein [Verrucomicrobiales bacterium]